MSVAQKQYGWTVLGTGLWKMWRGFLPFVVVAVLNAAVQASLLGLPVGWLALGISAAVLLIAFAFMTHIAVRSVSERSGIGDLRGAELARFALWVIVWTVVVSIGLAFYFIPGVILLLLTPFVPVAAAAGSRNPFAANFRAIGTRPVRWLLTGVFSLVVILVVWLLAGLNSFFVRGWVSSFTAWLIIGFAAAWLLTAWAALYASTTAGAVAETDEPATAQA